PDIYEQVLISIGSNARGAVLKGIVPQDERRVSDLLDSVKEGSADALGEPPAASTAVSDKSTLPSQQNADSLAAVEQRQSSMPPIILGSEMADELNAKVGSIVLVTSPQG